MKSLLLWLALLGTGPAGREAVHADSQSVVLELHPGREGYRGATEMYVTLSEPTRRLAVEVDRLQLARVEVSDSQGRVEVIWGERPAGTLLIEGRRDIAAGPVCIRVAFDALYADSNGVGLVRLGRGPRTRVLSNFTGAGAAAAFPCMLGVGPQRWNVTIEAPRTHESRTNLARQRSGVAPGVRTTLYRSQRARPVESLRIEVVPRARR